MAHTVTPELKHWGNTTKASFILQQCSVFAPGALRTVILSVSVKQAAELRIQRWSLHSHTQKMVEFDSFGQGSNRFTLPSPNMTFMNMFCTRLAETHLVSVSFPKDFLSTKSKESNTQKHKGSFIQGPWALVLGAGTAVTGGTRTGAHTAHHCTARPPSLSLNPPPSTRRKDVMGRMSPYGIRQTLVIHLGPPPLIRLLSNFVGQLLQVGE